MVNRKKDPPSWEPDIDRSVAEYTSWYLSDSPRLFLQAKRRAVAEFEAAMRATDDFSAFDADSLIACPRAISVARMSISPPMARERFVGFSRANKSLVATMEQRGTLPGHPDQLCLQPEMDPLRVELTAMCDFLRPLLDRRLLSWLAENRRPSSSEREAALLVVGERLASALYLARLRNTQEERQKRSMKAYLESEGFTESSDSAFEMKPGTFRFGRNVPVVRKDRAVQNLPVDCVVSPRSGALPLACVEMKSAGDFTNVNKRRKEESDKCAAIHRAYGDEVVFLLQLFGYFDDNYLDFVGSAEIDWAWDHRLSDLDPYFGIE